MRTLSLRLLSLLISLLALLGACATLPPPPPNTPAYAYTDVGDTRLGRIAAAAVPAVAAGMSGFRLLPEGPTAYGARLSLAERAERSLDVQYYLIGNDGTGRQFLRALRDASMRGVRVRLLVDDMFTAGEDELLAALAAYPNVQVRLFNPLPSRAGSTGARWLNSLHEFSRINHRMHNKLFIADNSFAVSGGRNIADEYFMHSAAANFIDLDVLSCGAVVRELSRAFDAYWNSEQVYPIDSVASRQTADRFDDLAAAGGATIKERPRDVLGNPPLGGQLDTGDLSLAIASARVFADDPLKATGVEHLPQGTTVVDKTLALFAQATEVSIASPYFIPGEKGMKLIRAAGATQENGRITLVTNSFGSTDEPMVYQSYARYRVPMLKAGVRIYEISPSLTRRSGRVGNFGRSTGRLHAKSAIIDRRTVFIGSMNLDPRSGRTNTEIGLIIESPEVAQTVGSLVGEALLAGAYKLRLGADGERIEWVETDVHGNQIVHPREPEDDWWLRLKMQLLRPFVPEHLL
jgi:putative cardiolipin synthase